MFNIGPGEVIVIALVLLIAVGPEQLPGVIRKAGRTMAQVRAVTDGLRTEFMAGLEEIERVADADAWTGSSAAASPAEPGRPAADPPLGTGIESGEPADPTANGGTRAPDQKAAPTAKERAAPAAEETPEQAAEDGSA